MDSFNEIIFDLPKTRDADIVSFLENIFNEYKKSIFKINNSEIDYKLIDDLCNSIIQSIKYHYDGNISESYNCLKLTLDRLENFLLIPKHNSFNVTPAIDRNCFRIRPNDSRHLSKKELFHIPFDERAKISFQRYSISGFPCLYLGESIYSCWIELNQPDLSKVQVSRFELPISYKFLDLTYDFQQFGFNYKRNGINELGLYYLTSWPLKAVCSLRVKEKDLPFKPEYIIPQIVLQWIRQSKNLDGIKYFSSIYQSNKKNTYINLINYVIPVKKISEQGYCVELLKNIKYTEPLYHKEFTLTEPDYMTKYRVEDLKGESIYKVTNKIFELELIKNQPVAYFDSVFGKMEIKLAETRADYLKI